MGTLRSVITLMPRQIVVLLEVGTWDNNDECENMNELMCFARSGVVEAAFLVHH